MKGIAWNIGQSAANLYEGSSETIRENNYKVLSVHRPNHVFPIKNKLPLHSEFGYYLAGLFDSIGSFNRSCFTLNFPSSSPQSISLAYKIRSNIGYGVVKESAGGLTYKLNKKEGLILLVSLLHNKIRHLALLQAILDFIKEPMGNSSTEVKPIHLTHYLAGLFDGAGYFSFKIDPFNPENLQIHCNISIRGEDKYIYEIYQDIIKSFGGGLLESGSYQSLTPSNLYLFILYFDKFHLNSNYLQYTALRKTYLLILENKQYTYEGYKKLLKNKELCEKKT